MRSEKTKHPLEKLIEQGENQILDFKFEISDSRKIARSLCAFANTDGGTLLIGVKDNGIIAGIRSDEEIYMLQAAAEYYSKPKITFKSKVWSYKGKSVLDIYIPQSKVLPHFVNEPGNNWKAYVRVADQNLPAPDILLKYWQKKKKHHQVFLRYSKKEHFLLNYLNTHEQISINDFSHKAMISKTDAETIASDLLLLEIIDLVLTENETYLTINQSFDVIEYNLYKTS